MFSVMPGKVRPAIRIDNKIAVGTTHADAIGMFGQDVDFNACESGWMDESGEFRDGNSPFDLVGKGCLLIRHAESESNIGLDRGHDPCLSEGGVNSLVGLVKFVARMANGGRPGVVSPMLRCLQTAKAIQDAVPSVVFRVEPSLSDAPEDYIIKDRRDEFSQFMWPESSVHHGNPNVYLDNGLRSVVDDMRRGAVVVSHASKIWAFVYELGRCRHQMCEPEDVPNASVSMIRLDVGCNCRFRKVSDAGVLL